jgi:hypothetical protein
MKKSEKTEIAIRKEASIAAMAFNRLEAAAQRAMQSADEINGNTPASLKLVAAGGRVRGFIQTAGGVSVQFDEHGSFAVEMSGQPQD